MAAAAAGGGIGEGGAGLGGAAGSELRGPGPSAETCEDTRGPVPAALHPDEVAARLQRMRRELSNRRKILVKNLPQDSSCQVRGRGWEATVPAGARRLGAVVVGERGRCRVMRTVRRFCKAFPHPGF